MFSFNSFKAFLPIFILPIILLFFISIFYIPILNESYDLISEKPDLQSFEFVLNSNGFIWPVPGYTKITSFFGYRKAPTYGASTYHSGIDIAAPEGSKLASILDGIVSFTGFSGAGGYTITIKSENFSISYCHVSPIFNVYLNQKISQGDIIGTVGPKNVYSNPNNPYKDSAGNPTNGATTGPHLHLTIKKDNQAVNPLDYL